MEKKSRKREKSRIRHNAAALLIALLAGPFSANAQTGAVRRTVLEEFSTAKCMYCPEGTEVLGRALAARPDVLWIVHHAGFLTDNITVAASSQLVYLYVGGTYAPAFMVDRTIAAQPHDEGSPVMGIEDSASIVALIDEMAAKECHTTVGFHDVSFDPASRRLQGRVEGRIDGDFDPQWTRLSVYIVEDSIALPQSSPTGTLHGYLHMHAVHGALTEALGSTPSFAADGSFSFSFDNLLPSTVMATHSRLVVLVHEFSRGIRSANRVLNAAATEGYLCTDRLAVGEADRGATLTLWPNPTADRLNVVADGTILSLRVHDMAGRLVASCNRPGGDACLIDTRAWPRGVYSLRVETATGSATRRFVKQ